MNKRKLKLLYIISFLLFGIFSCKHTTEYFEIDDSPEEIDFSNFHIEYCNYDSVHLVSNDDFYLDKMSVNEIIIYEQLKDTIALYCKVRPAYMKVDEKYRIDFEIPILASSPKVNYNIYFNMIDNKYVQIDTTVHYYRYNYDNAEFHFTIPKAPECMLFPGLVEYQTIYNFDIMHDGNLFVFRDSDDHFFSYDVLSGVVSCIEKFPELDDFDFGYFVTACNNVMYYEMNGNLNYNLFKCDLSTYSNSGFLDYDFYLNEFGFSALSVIKGLAADDNAVYVLHNYNGYLITTVNQAGNLINKIDWVESGFLEVYDNVLYSFIYENNNIIRYDINSGSFLPPFDVPHNHYYNGFRILDDRLYYNDYQLNSMISVPLSDLVN